jgi:hypothetical protein
MVSLADPRVSALVEPRSDEAMNVMTGPVIDSSVGSSVPALDSSVVWPVSPVSPVPSESELPIVKTGPLVVGGGLVVPPPPEVPPPDVPPPEDVPPPDVVPGGSVSLVVGGGSV